MHQEDSQNSFTSDLQFLMWFFKEQQEQYIDFSMMNKVENYAKKSGDRILRSLLVKLVELYWDKGDSIKDRKLLGVDDSVTEKIVLNKNRIKETFLWVIEDVKNELQALNQHRYIENPNEDLINTHTNKNIYNIFRELFTGRSSLGKRSLFEAIQYFRMELEDLVIDDQTYVFSTLYYEVLKELALMSIKGILNREEALQVLGLDYTASATNVKNRWQALAGQFIQADTLSLQKDSINKFQKEFLAYYFLKQSPNSFNEDYIHNQEEISEEKLNQLLTLLNIDMERWPELGENEIDSFYRKASFPHHPDKKTGNIEMFYKICEARDLLKKIKGQPALPKQKMKPQKKGAKAGPTLLLSDGRQPANEIDKSPQDFINNYKLLAELYLSKRSFSTWLIRKGFAQCIKIFSLLRFNKIRLILKFLADLNTKQQEPTASSFSNSKSLTIIGSYKQLQDSLTKVVLESKGPSIRRVAISLIHEEKKLKEFKRVDHNYDYNINKFSKTYQPPLLTDSEIDTKIKELAKIDGISGKIFNKS